VVGLQAVDASEEEHGQCCDQPSVADRVGHADGAADKPVIVAPEVHSRKPCGHHVLDIAWTDCIGTRLPAQSADGIDVAPGEAKVEIATGTRPNDKIMLLIVLSGIGQKSLGKKLPIHVLIVAQKHDGVPSTLPCMGNECRSSTKLLHLTDLDGVSAVLRSAWTRDSPCGSGPGGIARAARTAQQARMPPRRTARQSADAAATPKGHGGVSGRTRTSSAQAARLMSSSS